MPFSPSKRPFGRVAPAVAAFGAALMMAAPSASAAPTESVLYTFTGGSDGGEPLAGLNFDGAGNLYGTTFEGGAPDAGVAFKLTPNGAGGYSESVLHTFTNNASDGGNPQASLIADGAGNLYGTTEEGGASNAGVVFKLAPNGAGGYTESVLHSFTGNASDGSFPFAGLIADGAGNLYGTTPVNAVAF